MRSTIIPFSGFYNSLHDSELDRALEQMFSDESGSPYDSLVARAFDLIKWADVHRAYAAGYAGRFADEFGISGLEFKELNSPREYNFTTDRIFVRIPDEELARIHRETPRPTLDQVAAEWFTSRSGFCSFYAPDVESWGPFASWDHNQIGALIAAHVLHLRDGAEFDSWAEYGLMEDCRGNGHLNEWLSENAEPGVARLWKVCDYLRQREARAYRVGAAA